MKQISFIPSENFRLKMAFEPCNLDIKCIDILEIELEILQEFMNNVENPADFQQLCSYKWQLERVIEQRKLGQILN